MSESPPVVLPVREQFNYLSYLTFLTIGISYLWPWNSFLSATQYFSLRFAAHPNLQTAFTSSLMLISTLTSTSIFIYLVTYPKGSYTARVGYGEVIIAAAFFVLALTCIWGTQINEILYFMFVLGIMFVATVGASFAQNGSFAIVNLFPSIYTQAIMVGQAVAGILPPIVSILSEISTVQVKNALKAQGSDVPVKGKVSWSTFWSFVISIVIALAALGLFSLLVKQDAIKFQGDSNILPFPTTRGRDYQIIGEDEDPEEIPSSLNRTHSSSALSVSSPQKRTSTVSPRLLFRKLKTPALTVLLVFTASLSFPVFLQVVVPVHSSEDSIIFAPEVFAPLALFTWNLGDLLGRLLCGHPAFIVTRQRVMLIYSALRFLFLPMYFLCNVNGHGGLFNSDFIYFLIHFLFGLTNGQLGTSAMMVSSDYVNEDEKESAGSFMAMMLSFGLTLGSVLSFVLVAIIHSL